MAVFLRNATLVDNLLYRDLNYDFLTHYFLKTDGVCVKHMNI